jgi:ATP diphosphatase
VSQGKALQEILEVIDTLLGPNGCPWDKKQTPDSLCDYLIEETFELVTAIRNKDLDEIQEELGDVFFLLFFIARLYQDKFSLEQTFKLNAAKMIKRHPHVFGDKKIEDIEELLVTWEKIKKEEKEQKDKQESVFASIPPTLPPLLRAYRINSKAARIGFTWPKDVDQEHKLLEEWQEWLKAKASKDQDKMEEEFGDYLFSLTEYARRNSIKPNSALDKANNKFLHRFQAMEELATQKGIDLSQASIEEMDRLWEEVKKICG